MPYEYTPPKYAQVIDELRRRIESGEYPPGSLLPSEHQLSDEFQIARPTVVRALRVLRQDGWIETQQGKGSFVRGRPALAGLESQRTGEQALNRDESREPGELIEAAITAPPPPGWPRCSAPPGQGDVLARRLRDPAGRRGLGTGHLVGARALAEGTDLGKRRAAARRRARAPVPAQGRPRGSRPGAGHRPPSHQPRKPSCWAWASRRRCWRCTWPPATPRAGRCWSWRSSCPVTGTSSRTPTRSAETSRIHLTCLLDQPSGTLYVERTCLVNWPSKPVSIWSCQCLFKVPSRWSSARCSRPGRTRLARSTRCGTSTPPPGRSSSSPTTRPPGRRCG